MPTVKPPRAALDTRENALERGATCAMCGSCCGAEEGKLGGPGKMGYYSLYYLILTKLISNVDSFYYDQLISIYAKDRAIEKDAQTVVDIVEEIDAEDVATANNLEE
ncbi:hypothetical protein Godav_000528 [Gossypium davidsonii]|uniref:Uncharacterized protein n=1 Tax=Gossypium davidsonii TaxID=34287 RepID=A0A7J8T0D1_GOSDV|nr:hypothetical protein [Gossypium davidsonii]